MQTNQILNKLNIMLALWFNWVYTYPMGQSSMMALKPRQGWRYNHGD